MANEAPSEAPSAHGEGDSATKQGGCLDLGWGCLPVLALVALIPTQLFF
ncbi:MAG TPA: hypothetical protein VIL42_01615 [Sphingomicrobium sp.]|jgi:hypothetical protein